jgi:hypothetical protein
LTTSNVFEHELRNLILFLGYAFDLLGKKHKGFGEQILHTFQALKLQKNMGLLGKRVEICWF